MKNKRVLTAVLLCAAAVVFTLLVKFVGVEAVGPLGSEVGFGKLNAAVFEVIGEHKLFDLLSEIPLFAAIICAAVFALRGAVQLYRRRSLAKVETKLIQLGFIFLAVIVTYILFEHVIINYRPVTPDGVLEASYPSSHTMIAMSVLGSSALYLQAHRKYNRTMAAAMWTGTVLAPVLRLFSGQHWLTDIIGGCLFSLAFIALYRALIAGDRS
ncbi:MAG: phosphatase PAP2 family protein [Solobacterium sp.]|nr:phosphatase PAP2 family protein [Solobacterium sp.]